MSPWALFSVNIAGSVAYVPYHSDPNVRAIESGSKWGYSAVTYSFPDSRWDYDIANPEAYNFSAANEMQQNVVRLILEGRGQGSSADVMLSSVEAFTNLDLVYAGRNGANIRVSNSDTFGRNHAFLPIIPGYRGTSGSIPKGFHSRTSPGWVGTIISRICMSSGMPWA